MAKKSRGNSRKPAHRPSPAKKSGNDLQRAKKYPLKTPPTAKTNADFGTVQVREARPQFSPAVFIVFLCCTLFALQLGILEPNFYFQQTAAQVVISKNCSFESSPGQAYAVKNIVAMPIMDADAYSAFASFEGNGNVESAQLNFDDPYMSISRLVVNGKEVCAPCNLSKKIALELKSGRRLDVALEAKARQPTEKDFQQSGTLAFFKKRLFTRLVTPLSVELGGGWQASANGATPSSFYGVDAPFHINRIPVLAGYLQSFSWPDANYGFLSALPPALLYMAGGVSHQYAYKVYEILLFFVPIVLFYFFSRKLSVGKNSAFLFSSLIYLFLPAVGYPVGGGPDLFFYGMTAHTLATYLSLAFFYFGYMHSETGSRKTLALSALFFLLAFLSNQRILVALGAMLAVLCAKMLWDKRNRRAVVFAVACAAAVAWAAIPFAHSFSFGTYTALGGVKVEGEATNLVMVAQTGYLVLPLLFLSGAYAAWKQKQEFALLLGGAGVLVFAITTSPWVNGAFPFIDGLRFLPSFFLPVFFIAGIGVREAFSALMRGVNEYQRRTCMDRTTLAGAFALALLAPAAIVFLITAFSTVQQYSQEKSSFPLLMEYAALEKDYAIIGAERSIFISPGAVSQYPVFEKNLLKTNAVGFENASSLAGLMEKENIRYVIFGNVDTVSEIGGRTRRQQYEELASDPRFARLPSHEAAPLFVLNGVAGSVAGEPVFHQSHYGYELPLAVICAAVVAICLLLSGKNASRTVA